MHIHRYNDTDEIEMAKGVMAGFDGGVPILRLKQQCRCGKIKYLSLNMFVPNSEVNGNKFEWK